MTKNEILKILESAKDKNGDVPMRLIRQAFEKLPEPCTGTISRQAAIDAVIKESNADGAYGYMDTKDIVDLLNKLPSAQPEQRWIPCSERMPEGGENCLVSVRCSNDFLVDRGTYSTDLFNVDEEDFFGNRGESGWYYINSEYGYCRILNVIAWMPLPEPYKKSRN